MVFSKGLYSFLYYCSGEDCKQCEMQESIPANPHRCWWWPTPFGWHLEVIHLCTVVGYVAVSVSVDSACGMNPEIQGKLRWCYGNQQIFAWKFHCQSIQGKPFANYDRIAYWFAHQFGSDWLTRVAALTSRMIASKAAVSSACFWLWSAIFSLNFLGFAMMAVNSDLLWFWPCRGSSVVVANQIRRSGHVT